MIIYKKRFFLKNLLITFMLFFIMLSFYEGSSVYAVESFDQLAARNLINIYSEYLQDEGTVQKGSFNDVDPYDVFVLEQAGIDLEKWSYNGTSLKESVISIINTTIANEESSPENAKYVTWQYLAAYSLGENWLEEQLFNILLSRQLDNADGTFFSGDYGEWTNLPVFDALAKRGTIGQTDVENGITYILSLQNEENGSFSDYMTTAQAVRALFALKTYAGEREGQVQAAIENALSWMQSKIQEDGSLADSFDDVLTDTVEAIVTLEFLGRDPDSWIHNTTGNSPVDYMRDRAQDIFDNGNIDQNTWALEAYLALGADPTGSLGISISPDGADVAVGGIQQFTAQSALPDGSISDVTDVAVWTVSNSELASVNNGLLTRIAEGDVELTATYNGVSDTVTVGTSEETLARVAVRIEGPEYTILPETIIAVPASTGYAEILIAGADANGYTAEYSESEYGIFINSINGIAGSPYWMVTPYQAEGYQDGDSFVFSGNGSTNQGELSLPDPAEVTAGTEFNVTVTFEGVPVEGATVIYYTADRRTNPHIAGMTDSNGELIFSIAEAGTYYIAAAEENTAQYPDPDNGLVRTVPQEIVIRTAGGGAGQSGVTVSVKVIGKNGETLFGPQNMTLYPTDIYGITPVGALDKTGLSYDYDTIDYIHTIAGQGPQGQNGWMYKVNNESSASAAIDYELSPGDRVLWFYSTDSGNIAGVGGSKKIPSKSEDEIIRASIENNEEILIQLAKKEGNNVTVPAQLIEELKNRNKGLSIANEGVRIDFTSQTLFTELTADLVNDENGAIILGASVVSPSDKYEIFKAAGVGESTGIFDIGGALYNFTAQYQYTHADGTKGYRDIAPFSDFVKVTIDLSDKNLTDEEIAMLCAIRYERDADGNIYAVKLGGVYDSDSKEYTFYTDKFSYYAVMKVANLTKIRLDINKLTTYVNDRASFTDVPPVIINDRTMVPLRFIAESFGADIKWIGADETVEIRMDDRLLKLIIGKTGPGLDTPAIIKGGRTMVPIRYVAEHLGASVKWIGTGTVEIVK